MPISRLKNDPILFDNKRKAYFGRSQHLENIRNAINNGNIPISETIVLSEEQRLDTIAGQKYGDGRYWWILAIASGIGYGLQVPPGTVIVVPELSGILQNI